MRSSNHHLPFCLLLTASIAACSERVVPLEEVTETTLGGSGGLASSAAGELTLEFPAGVLAEGSVVRIQTDRAARVAGLVGPVFELKVAPPIARFAEPVELAIRADAQGARLIVANLDGAAPVEVAGSTHDAAAGIVRASLEHFSRYGAIRAPSGGCPATPPGSGDACSEGLRCEYGEECCCGACHPSLVYTCNAGVWIGLHTDACLGAGISCPDAGAPSCPAEMPALGSPCDHGLDCEYGQECCCGECHPSMVLTCDQGAWLGLHTDACLAAPQRCPDAGPSTCPTEMPALGSPCSEGLRCEYGQECCCGACYPSMVLTCGEGAWVGFHTDACLGAPAQCPDAG